MSDDHNCAEHFEYTKDKEIRDKTCIWRGNCTECGRPLAQVYEYTETIDTQTNEIVDQRVPEHVEQIHSIVSELVTAAEAGEKQHAVKLQQKVEQQLHALITGVMA